MTISRNDARFRLEGMLKSAEEHLQKMQRIAPQSKVPSPVLKELLARVFDQGRHGKRREVKAKEYKRRRHDFVFHMTDWLQNLQELAKLYHHPVKADLEQTTISVFGFLYHVVPHLTTAGRLLLDKIADPFVNDWPLRKNGKIYNKKRSARKAKVSS